MDYLKHYWKLIETRRGLQRSGYLESHHIVPKSVYDSGLLPTESLDHVNDPRNLIELSGREHFVAHWLLHRAFPKSRNLAAGFFAMANLPGSTKKRFIPSSRAVAEAREAYSVAQGKAVARYSLDGQLLEIHDSTNEAAAQFDTNVHNISAATNPTNGVNNVAGFLWRRFTKEPEATIEPFINQNTATSRQVHQYDFKGNFVKSFPSLREADRAGVLRRDGIDTSIEKTQFSNGNFFLVSSEKPALKIEIQRSKTVRRRVLQIDKKTGAIIRMWNSSREPKTELGIYNVNDVCNGKRKSMGGFIWKWADDETPFDKDQPLTQKPKAKPFELFRDEVFLGKFFSMRDAEEATGIKRGQIAKARDRDGWKGITVRLVS